MPDGFWSRLREVADVLVYTFDLEVFERPIDLEAYAADTPWLPAVVIPDAAVSVIARNGMGALYLCCEQAQRRCYLHVDARGSVVQLGDDLQQVIALIVALPYWPELLAQGAPLAQSSPLAQGALPPRGSVLTPSQEEALASLRELARHLERETCEDVHAIPEARAELRTFLELPVLDDPVRYLYQQALQQPAVAVWSPHGWRYESPLLGAARRVA